MCSCCLGLNDLGSASISSRDAVKEDLNMLQSVQDCRESGHWWPVTDGELGGFWKNGKLASGQKCLIRQQLCVRGCGLIRIKKISPSTGKELVKPQYIRPKGYGVSGDRAAIRKSQVDR